MVKRNIPMSIAEDLENFVFCSNRYHKKICEKYSEFEEKSEEELNKIRSDYESKNLFKTLSFSFCFNPEFADYIAVKSVINARYFKLNDFPQIISKLQTKEILYVLGRLESQRFFIEEELRSVKDDLESKFSKEKK